jgi:hypothetical protein
MTPDLTGTDITLGAALVAVAGGVLYVAGCSRFGSLLGIRPEAPRLLPPVAAKLVGLLVGYLAVLVAVGGLVHARMDAHGIGHPTLISIGAATFWAAGTVTRVCRHVGRLIGWRTAVTGILATDEVLPVDEIGDDVDLAAAVDATRNGDW